MEAILRRYMWADGRLYAKRPGIDLPRYRRQLHGRSLAALAKSRKVMTSIHALQVGFVNEL